MSDRPRRWRYSEDELRRAVRDSRSYREVLGHLGLSQQGGGSYATLQRRIAELQLSTAHFTGQGLNRENISGHLRSVALPLDELLVADSACRNPGRLKQRLMRLGLLGDRCAICGIGPSWRGAPLVLRMDHVNGVRTDNRLTNLRLVCPNCDSQLPTFAGRNKARRQ